MVHDLKQHLPYPTSLTAVRKLGRRFMVWFMRAAADDDDGADGDDKIGNGGAVR
jgi:hypothetical protein